MKILGMGGFELVIILVVILLIFGPKNLPKLGNALGKTVSNLRAGMNEGKKGKEKEDGAEGASEEDTAASVDEPAALEGEVEVVEDVAGEPPASVASAAEELVDAGEAAVEDVAEEAAAVVDELPVDEVAASTAGDDVAAVEADAGADAPRKVRRVVRKKPASEE